MATLAREEYIEQAYLFQAMAQRINASDPVQELLGNIRQEVLATTQLPMAIKFLLAELRHVGTMGTAMRKLGHYFHPFQAFLVEQAEDDNGRFDMQVAFALLRADAKFRCTDISPAAMFFFQFEILCRNRLDYDYGLQAMAGDPVYTDAWPRWILDVRHKIGIIELADLVYVHSEHYLERTEISDESERPDPILFGDGEGRIALANRKKEPHYLFSALQRQLDYPAMPKMQRADPILELVPKLNREVQRLEVRIKLLEEEQRTQGIDITQFYGKQQP